MLRGLLALSLSSPSPPPCGLISVFMQYCSHAGHFLYFWSNQTTCFNTFRCILNNPLQVKLERIVESNYFTSAGHRRGKGKILNMRNSNQSLNGILCFQFAFFPDFWNLLSSVRLNLFIWKTSVVKWGDMNSVSKLKIHFSVMWFYFFLLASSFHYIYMQLPL